jgi:ATP-dependent helicase/nuclease subunit B
MIRAFVSPSSRNRLQAALDFAREHGRDARMLVLGASRDAADDLVRELTLSRHATFGIERASPLQLASRLALGPMAERGSAPATGLAVQAVAARAAFEVNARRELQVLEPVIAFPGFPAALAETLHELRGARTPAAELESSGAHDLSRIASVYAERLDQDLLCDSSALYELATRALIEKRPEDLPPHVILLDVPIQTIVEREFHRALLGRARDAIATVPMHDGETLEALLALGASPQNDTAASTGAVDRLRAHLFSETAPPRGKAGDDVQWFSAPGEARESIEIARRILDVAAQGVPLDRIAVFLRNPEAYVDHLVAAFRRGSVPAYFDRGARRPDPAGRAFLALLACRSEGLSARRFAEYLSFGQVPDPDPDGAPPRGKEEWTAATDEVLATAAIQTSLFDEPEAAPSPPDVDERPVLAGTLRAPWKWEELLVEAAVIGGRGRWERRLRGLRNELERKRDTLRATDQDPGPLAGVERDLTQLGHLERFALPVIGMLDALPGSANWGEWLDALAALAPRALRRPTRVLELLAELRPMASVGPVGIDEVQVVLQPRLASLEQDSPSHRFGRVFVASPEGGRGRSFDVVFVPGLAERSFPYPVREDPLFLDRVREKCASALPRKERRVERERLRLLLAVGAAEKRVVVSYPRIDGAEGRPRVPSFYGLDLVRAVTGELPEPEQFERDAAAAGAARLAWPAPEDPDRAIDAAEHDLAVIGGLFKRADDKTTRGRARYLFSLNPHLGRSLRARRARWRHEWGPEDGLVRTTPEISDALAVHSPEHRVYSATGLERYATCPYKFLLGTIHRLEPREEPTAIIQLDPLLRGSIIHEILAETIRALEKGNLLPPSAERLDQATKVLDATLQRVSSRWREDLAPAIPRVWDDEMREIRIDARRWLVRLVEEAKLWAPLHVEYQFGFGAPPNGAPGHAEPAPIGGGWRLHGAVDSIDAAADGSALRITDYKTGSNHFPRESVLAGGRMLQPMLYALAVEEMLHRPVRQARLDFCTTRGGFTTLPVDIGPYQRNQADLALAIIKGAIVKGLLHPAPLDGACAYCDFRSVCGPTEQRRWHGKDRAPLEPLFELRGLQ